MSLPSIDVFRERVEAVTREDIRYCLMTAYIYCGRISEVVAQAYKVDNTVARGPRGTDVRLDFIPLRKPVAVFTVRTAKRGGLERRVAVPVNYEPWAKSLVDYFKRFGNEPVFPFTQQKVRYYVYKHKIFEGLSYPIETYSIYKDGELVKKVERYIRSFTLQAIRHLRASELVDYYGFTGPELATYGGWTFKSVGFPTATDRYLSLGWQTYIAKLFKKRV